jgi:hypothetical protein
MSNFSPWPPQPGKGLYSTRLLVQAHGGRIWVDSALGKGTTLYVALTTARSEERRDVASVSLGASDGRRPRVIGARSDELKG